MTNVRLAVIGAGHLGKIHARLAAQAAGATLTVIAEPNLEAGQAAAGDTGARCVERWQEAATEFDAAIVAAPTSIHHAVGLDLIAANKHVLMEKPICESTESAAKLVAAARAANRVLQVGHIERFNPAFHNAAPLVSSPLHIEAAREGGYTGRSVDVGVVLDLMIHDIDLVLSIVNSPLQRVTATGASVVGPHEDMAHAWLEFANGATACLKASRVSHQPTRQMRVVGPYSSVDIDFAKRTAVSCHPTLSLAAHRTSGAMPTPEFSATVQRQLPQKEIQVAQDANPIMDEHADFIASINNSATPRVSGEDGLRALSVAEEVGQRIRQRLGQMRTQPQWPQRKAA